MSEEKLQVAVGDTVMVLDYYSRKPATESLVTKVGRKYVYISLHEAFDLVTGRERTSFGGSRKLYTSETWSAHLRRSEVINRLQADHNIGPVMANQWRQDTDTLEAVLNLLDTKLEGLPTEISTIAELEVLAPGSVIRCPDGEIGMVMVTREKRHVIGWPGHIPTTELREVLRATYGDPITVLFRR